MAEVEADDEESGSGCANVAFLRLLEEASFTTIGTSTLPVLGLTR